MSLVFSYFCYSWKDWRLGQHEGRNSDLFCFSSG